MKPIQIQFTPLRSNYVEAYVAYDEMSRLRKLDKIVSILLIAAGITLGVLSIRFRSDFEYLLAAIGFLLLGVVEWFHLVDPGKWLMMLRFNWSPKFKELQTLTCRSDGIDYAMSNIQSTIQWSFYTGFLESQNTFLLIYGKRQYSVIPKDALTGEQLADFKKLLLEKFP
jgi:YcxB-like protein